MNFLSPKQLARRWGVSTRKLADDRRAGRGVPHIQTGFAVLYSLADVLGYEARNGKFPGGTRSAGGQF